MCVRKALPDSPQVKLLVSGTVLVSQPVAVDYAIVYLRLVHSAYCVVMFHTGPIVNQSIKQK